MVYSKLTWERGRFSAPEAVEEAVVYALTNPVKDGLVADYRNWPGVNSKPAYWTQASCEVARLGVYFDQTSGEWASCSLQFVVPPTMLSDHGSAERAARDMEQQLEQAQIGLARERSATGRRFRTPKELRNVDPLGTPKAPRSKSEFAPALAAAGRRDMLELAKRVLKEFRPAYREAYEFFRRGQPATFPFGTYLLRVRQRVPTESNPGIPWCAAAG